MWGPRWQFMSVKNQSKTGPISTKNEKMEMAVFVVSSYVWILLDTYLVTMLLSAWAPVQDSLVSLVFEGILFIPVLPLWLWFNSYRFQMALSARGTDPAYKLSAECHSKISIQFLVGTTALKTTLPSTIFFRLCLIWKDSGKWKVGRS